MTQAAIRLTAKVLPGKRIEFTAPELVEGQDVEIFVALPTVPARPSTPSFASAADYLASLPARHRTPEEWAQIERELQEDKDSWDR